MSRILFAWELGGNLGHIAHCLPLAEKLREAGHEIVFAAKDTRTAAALLRPARFAFLQSPLCTPPKRRLRPPVNYAEVLAAQGWGDRMSLVGHIQSWAQLIALGRFDAVIVEHAPGALVAAHVLDRLAIPFGNGFEIPPDVEPMPGIRIWESHSPERLLASERHILGNINAVVSALGGKPYPRLGSLFPAHSIFATFPELDHYGPRPGANYVGSVHGLKNAIHATWPPGDGKRIVVYLRPQHRATPVVMEELAALRARAVCVIPEASAEFKRRYATDAIAIHDRLLTLAPLLAEADAMIGYASIGTMAEALFNGVPLFMLPTTVEQYLVAKRAEAGGFGIMLDGSFAEEKVRDGLAALLSDPKYGEAARAFAKGKGGEDRAAEVAARCVVELLAGRDV